ncbi:MAG TPA: RibD family protein, partial [Candidatus Norongarragalinales archaeon]|nr:RibD family protein [Candidatus Norongarragalinales archaeon]
PRLSLRIRGAKQPLRVILDGRLHCPIDSKVFRDPNVIVFCDARAPVKKMNSFREKGISLIRFSSKKVPLLGLLRELAKRNVATLLVEGGSKTASDFLRQRLVDRGLFFVAPFISGTGLPMFENLGELRPVKTKATLLGNNVLIDVEF